MSTVLYANNANSTLAGAITNVATTANLAAGTGVLFPSPSGGQYFVGSFTDAATGLLTEIVHVTDVTGDVITMVRAQEGTSAIAWNAGDIFANLWTAGQAANGVQGTDLQEQATNYAADTGSTNHIAIALSPVPGSIGLLTGAPIRVRMAHTNTSTTVDITINGLSAIPVKNPDGSLPAVGQLVEDGIFELISDGTEAQIQSITAPSTSGPPSTELNAWGSVSGGSANNQTVTTTPSFASYVAGQRVSFIAGFENTGALQLNANGLGNRAVLKQTPGGTPVAMSGGEIPVNTRVELVDDGTQYVLQVGEPIIQGVGGTRRNLLIVNSGTPDTILNVTCDEIILEDQYSRSIRVKSVNTSINSGTSGAGGVDTGSVAPNTAYDLYIGYNPVSQTVTAWMTVSGNSPIAPSGYTFYRRVGWQRTDGSSHFYRVRQVNDQAQYVVTGGTNTAAMPAAATGNSGSPTTPTYTTVSLSGLIPPTAIKVFGLLRVPTGAALLAPNGSYGSYSSSTNPPPFLADINPGYAGGTVNMLLESLNAYYASSGGSASGFFILGWQDNI